MTSGADLAPSRLNFGVQELWQLALWAVAAAAGLALAVYAGSTETGRNRMRFAVTQIHHMIQTTPVKEIRPFDAKDGQKLAETVRLLTADRDRLRARLAAVERNISDISGSLARVEEATRATQAAQKAQAERAAQAVQAAQAAQAALAAQVVQAVQTARAAQAEQAAQPTRAARSTPPMQPTQSAQTEPAAQVMERATQPEAAAAAEDVTSSINPAAAVPMPPQAPAAPKVEQSTSSTAGKTHFGLDLGSATTTAELHRLWASARRRHRAQLARLHPVVQPHRSTLFGGIEWRLVAGPIASPAVAAKLCAAVAAHGDGCRVAVFQGQRLADR